MTLKWYWIAAIVIAAIVIGYMIGKRTVNVVAPPVNLVTPPVVTTTT